MKNVFALFCFILVISSCTFNGRSHEKHDGITSFINGSAAIDKVKDVHVINMIRAIGAPNNNVTVGKFKYYQWNHDRTVGVSTLLGGGSTTLYCSMTAETQGGKIKLINWYGNQCGVFLDPIGEYFKDKLNIAVITDEDEKKQNDGFQVKSDISEQDIKGKNSEQKSSIDLRQKTLEQKNFLKESE